MNRRGFVAFFVGALAAPLARAQGNVRTIGLLWNDSVKPSPHVATLLGALSQLGWRSGKNLKVLDNVALEGYGPMAENAAALVRQRCDVIVTYGATATLTAAKATKEIPIAMLIGADPVRAGLAASLARPGGNVTGVINLSVNLIGKRLELLRELAPEMTGVGILVPNTPALKGRTPIMDETKAAAGLLKLTPHFVSISKPDEIDAAVAGFAKAGLRGVYVFQGTLLAAHSTRIVRAVAAHGLVAVYPLDRYAEEGGLLAYAPSETKAFARLAYYVDRLLKGARPADMPIEQMGEVELVINLRTAKALGIKIPHSILQRADRAIE